MTPDNACREGHAEFFNTIDPEETLNRRQYEVQLTDVEPPLI